MAKTIEEPITHAVFIRARITRGYDAIIAADGLDKWFTNDGEVDARVGGFVQFRWVNWGVDRVEAQAGGSGYFLERVF